MNGGDRSVTLSARGELDISTTSILGWEIDAVLAGGRSQIGLLLCEVCFIDSAGVGVVVTGLKRCRAAGGDLRLVHPRGQVARTLVTMGLHRIFAIEADHDGCPAG